MALSTLTYKLSLTQSITAQKSLTGTDYSPIANSSNISKAVSLGTAAANAAAGGADELASFITSISASSSATIDLTSLTDILNVSSVSLARVKALVIRLLSTSDDSTNGTAASSVTVGNNASNDFVSLSHGGWFGTNTSTFDIPNGGFLAFGVGNAAGNVVNTTNKIIKIANNDSGVTAKVQTTVCGGTT